MNSWTDCPSCNAVRIRSDSVPLLCSNCGGALCNCLTCGHGRSYWTPLQNNKWECPSCGGDPFTAGSGRADWKDFGRAKMVAMFGPKMPGDIELVQKYASELHGYDRAVPLESLVRSVVNRDRLGNQMLG